MKYVKKFENFKEWNYVYCINPGSTGLEKDKPYRVNSITYDAKDKQFYIFIKFDDSDSDNDYAEFNKERFISELEYKQNKYNL
jgi:hypothetical protein